MASTKNIIIGLYSLLGLLLIFLCYCLHFNVDLSDESFYLYFFQHGSSEATFNFYHFFVSAFSKLAGNKLILYRYLTVVSIFISSLLLAMSSGKSDRHFRFMISLSLGLCYFNLISTFSYNSLVFVCGAIILSQIMMIHEDKHSYLAAIVIGIMSFLAFSARFGPGLIFLGLSSATTFALHRKSPKSFKLAAVSLASFLLLLSATWLMNKEVLIEMLQIIQEVTKSTHKGLAGKYVSTLISFLQNAFLPPLIILFLARKSLKVSIFAMLVIALWHVSKELVITYDYLKFIYYIFGMFLAYVSVYSIQRIRNGSFRSEDLVHVLLPVSFYAVAYLGTNNNFLKISSYNVLLLFPAIYYLFLNESENFKLKAFTSLVCIGLAFTSVYKKQFWESYRSPPRNQQHFVQSSLPALSGVYIDQKLEDDLLRIAKFYDQHQIDFKRDLILAYPDLPGYVSLFGGRGFGTPWQISGYPNADRTNCFQLERQKLSGNEKIFVVLETPLSPQMQNCLEKKAGKLPVFVLNLNQWKKSDD